MIAFVTKQLWIDFDLDTAVFLDSIAYWVGRNAANKKQQNYHDGRYWSYNTQEAFQKMFPGWSRDSIRRIIRNCVKHELLLLGNFNQTKFDRTSWYSISDKALVYYPGLISAMKQVQNFNDSTTKCTNTLGDSNQSSPVWVSSDLEGLPLVGSTQWIGVNPPTYTNNITIKGLKDTTTASEAPNELQDKSPATPKRFCSSSSKDNELLTRSCPKTPKPKNQSTKQLELMQGMIEIYRQVFPDNPQPHPRLIATSLKKTLQALINRWPEADPQGFPLDLDAFRRYMEHLRLSAPKFALSEYTTQEGNRKKNGMETFCRWNTLVKLLEGQYS